MNQEEKKSILVQKVLEKIKSGKVKMKPKIYFILKSIFFILGILITGLFVLYFVSFIFFVLRASGVWYLSLFGFVGFHTALKLLPWFLILLVLILIIVLEILVKHFAFAYRRPVLYSLVVIIILTLLGSFIIAQTKFHSEIFKRTQTMPPPFFGPMYHRFSMPKFQNLHRGVVLEKTENGFQLETFRGEILKVIISQRTQFPFEKDIREGDNVIVLGRRDDNTIQAFGIHKVRDELNIFPRRHSPPLFY